MKHSLLAHSGVGGVVGGLIGIGATGAPLVFPAGAAVGALAGSMVGKRVQALPSDKAPTLALKRKDAEHVFAALESASALIQLDNPSFNVIVDRSAALRAHAKPGSRLASSKGYTVKIGLPLLFGLSLPQFEALAAHALVVAQSQLETASVEASTVARLDAAQARLATRKSVLRLANLSAFQDHALAATRTWHTASEIQARDADQLTARFAGPKALVDALLTQALIASRFAQNQQNEVPLGDALSELKASYSRTDLDGALRLLAQTQHPSAQDAMLGLPFGLLQRLSGLDTSCAVPSVPAASPIAAAMPEKTLAKLEKRLADVKAPKVKKTKAQGSKSERKKTAKPAKKNGLFKSKKRQSGEAVGRLNELQEAGQDAKKKSLLSGLLTGKKTKTDQAISVSMHDQPLYQADEIFKGDPGTGLEAYQALVDAHPRWTLARLRLAEAQLETGFSDAVSHLMACAENLPSALPTILDRLQSGLAMVSPLDGERLRQAIDQMHVNADAIACERAEIDLENLTTATMDAQDQATLEALFGKTHGLREAWVLAMPCAWMPEVPHHAILGLAPRLHPEDAQVMALSLAEHAAITGTVAVHIETGTPRGALGDALASHSSVWRAQAHQV
ncbi:MAG: hypothetical protein AB8B88_05700 [Devosiaceae bacterium]